jgi:CheY-like chemotaxis protein
VYFVVLDDSLVIRMTIEAFLEDLGVDEEHIYSFDDGNKALEFIKKNENVLIFSDINMPKMNGIMFTDELLKISNNFIASLFIVSGEESSEGLIAVKDAGAKRFIKKPIDKRQFVHFVKPEIEKRYKLR